MRYLAVLLFIFFSCKKVKEDKIISKDVSIKNTAHGLRDEKFLDTIRSFSRNDTLTFQLKNVSIAFVDGKENCRKNILVNNLKSGVVTKVETPDEICFERNSIYDFSPNQKILILHAVEKGILSDGNLKEQVEKYNCMFLDIEEIMLSDKYSSLFCSGEWKDPDQWYIDKEKYYKAEDLFNKL